MERSCDVVEGVGLAMREASSSLKSILEELSPGEGPGNFLKVSGTDR